MIIWPYVGLWIGGPLPDSQVIILQYIFAHVRVIAAFRLSLLSRACADKGLFALFAWRD